MCDHARLSERAADGQGLTCTHVSIIAGYLLVDTERNGEKTKAGLPDAELAANNGLPKNAAGLDCDFQLFAF